MPKRFTDTDIWKKKWYRQLPPAEKIGFKYIMENCDNVGVWDGDTDVADFLIGDKVDWGSLPDKTNGNIELLKCGKWWLVDFVRFQHSDLFSGSQSNACKSYVRLLQKHGLYERFTELFEAFGMPSEGLSQAPKERVKAKDKAGVKVGAKDKAKAKDTTLYNTMMKTFEGVYGQMDDYKKEGPNLKQLIKHCEVKAGENGDTPEEVAHQVLATFQHLREHDTKFWQDQPFTPSALNSLFSRVYVQVEKLKKKLVGEQETLERMRDFEFQEITRK